MEEGAPISCRSKTSRTTEGEGSRTTVSCIRRVREARPTRVPSPTTSKAMDVGARQQAPSVGAGAIGSLLVHFFGAAVLGAAAADPDVFVAGAGAAAGAVPPVAAAGAAVASAATAGAFAALGGAVPGA